MKNDFHDHLDRCCQCSRNPFDLCPAGEYLLRIVVSEEPPNFGRVIRYTPATTEQKAAAGKGGAVEE